MAFSERQNFLLSIRDKPDEDLPRLAFADWLEEHGEPERAKLIRLQIAVDRDDLSMCQPMYPGCAVVMMARGGTVERVSLPWELWREHGDIIWERELPWKVRLTTRLTLTAGGDIEFVGTTSKTFRYRVAGRVVAVKRYTERPAHGWGPWKVYVLSARWPGIEFELPAVREELSRPPRRGLGEMVRGRDLPHG